MSVAIRLIGVRSLSWTLTRKAGGGIEEQIKQGHVFLNPDNRAASDGVFSGLICWVKPEGTFCSYI